MKTILTILCSLILAGCSRVLIKEPFPETVLTEEERENLQGAWRVEDSVMNIAFTSNGIPWYAAVQWIDDDFKLEKERLYFSKHNDMLYICMPNDPGKTNGFYFAEYKQEKGKALLWMPNGEFFEKLVEQGILTGSIEKDKYSSSIKLDTPAVAILELIATNPAAFNYKNPVVLEKLE